MSTTGSQPPAKYILEIYEGDPFEASCCGPGKNDPNAARQIRTMLMERKAIVDQILGEFGDRIRIERQFINPKVTNYPEYVDRILFMNEKLPFFIFNKVLIHSGRFLTFKELQELILTKILGKN
jgi:hypothetical protein